MNKRTILLLNATIFICVALCGQVCNAEPWKVTLHLDGNKPEYLIGEPIYFTKTIENAGSAKDTFWFDEKGSFMVYDQNGDTIFTPIGFSFYAEPQLVQHDTPRVSCLDLTDFYQCANWQKGIRFLTPGNYKVQTRIRVNINDPKKKLEYLYSDVVSINIAIPEGNEKDAYDKYVKALEMMRKGHRYEYYEKVFTNHPNSVYAPQSHLSWIWWKATKSNNYLWKADEMIKLFNKYPNHPRAKTWVSSVILALGTAKRPELVADRLSKLKSKTKNKEVIEEIDLELHKYETGYYKHFFEK